MKVQLPEKITTQEEYTAHVFLLMGQFQGVMDKAKRQATRKGSRVSIHAEQWRELVEISDAMWALYRMSKEAGL